MSAFKYENHKNQRNLRAKLISTINYVDKGQNKIQLRDFSLFLKKNMISIINDVGSAYTASLFSYKTMLKPNGQQNPEMNLFSGFRLVYCWNRNSTRFKAIYKPC